MKITSLLISRFRKELGLDALSDWADGISRRLGQIENSRQAAPKPEPYPFVAAMVMGYYYNFSTERWEATTFGEARELSQSGDILELQPDVPLKNTQIVIFSDLRRVRVIDIRIGSRSLMATLGPCPIGKLDDWPVAVKVRIVFSLVNKT